MTLNTRLILCAAALFTCTVGVAMGVPFHGGAALAQSLSAPLAAEGRPLAPIAVREKRAAPSKAAPAPKPASSTEPPPRIPFTAAEDEVAAIPGIPDARFWADSEADFKAALPAQPGPWLALSSGGSDGAFGAGLLDGLSAAGKRPDYAVVTGVSTGALMAPFVFAGARYDDALRNAYTTITAADVFEAGHNSESFVDSWPLRDQIAKQITPALLADVAAAHKSGRRLFIVTFDLDAERGVVWNMGAIAQHGGDEAAKLFRSVLLASASVPGGFPPVLIDVEANGKRFAEMHVDGGTGGQFYVVPPPLMATNSDYRLPATQLYVVVNTGLGRDFKVVDRFVPSILSQAVGGAVKADTRMMLSLAYALAKRSNVEFFVASIPPSFNAPSRGAFDPDYMKALFQVGFEQGRGSLPFSTEPPPFPGSIKPQSSPVERTGANQ